jgi:hypothetical protein
MHFKLPSFDRGALRAASLALFGMSIVAACDTDRPVEPTAAVPAAASAFILPIKTGTLVWKVTDEDPSPLGGAKFQVTGPKGATWFLADNFAPDSDPISGNFRLAGLQPGTYTVCEIMAPLGYALPDTPCRTKDVFVGDATHVKSFINKELR